MASGHIPIIVFCIFLLVALVLGFGAYDVTAKDVGYVVKDNPPNTEATACCTVEGKTCYALSGFTCDFCTTACGE